TAPAGAVVRVGPGSFRAPTGARALPLTLLAEFPALDDARAEINPGLRSVVDSGVVAGPAGAPEPGVAPAPWRRVALPGPGTAGAPAGATYQLWKWAGLGAAPGWLGYAPSRAAAPTRLAAWALTGGPAAPPAASAARRVTHHPPH